MAHVVACQTVLIREDWMRKHMEGHESEKVWSYSQVSQFYLKGQVYLSGIDFF